MNPLVAQQVALDDALVAPENRSVIGKCNMRMEPTKTPKELTYQIAMDTLKLYPCYQAFLVTPDFKLDKKKFRNGVEVFCEVLQIYPSVSNPEFVEPPSHEEIVTFIKEIGYEGELESITEFYIDHMSQP
ncbi:hypothetical protein Tco_0268958 [Tanacetum coccineum]